MLDPTGHRQIGEYELIEALGAGGQSTVFKAWHRLMKRHVAIKILHSEQASEEESRRRFRVEIEVSAMLSHPHILRAYDASEFQGVEYLVMELREGTDLANVIRTSGPLPAVAAIDYIRQSALGLAYAHERGIIHRDVKPHNLFLGADKTVMVFDWGLARLNNLRITVPSEPKPEAGASNHPPEDNASYRPRAVSEKVRALETYASDPQSTKDEAAHIQEVVREHMAQLAAQRPIDQTNSFRATNSFAFPITATRTLASAGGAANLQHPQLTWSGHFVGTPAFMAPEQARSQNVDFRADVYSLGATLFYLLVGRPMYSGNVLDVLRSHENKEIPSLADFRGDLPVRLEDIFQKMVAKKPENRFDSMSEVIAALDGVSGRCKVFLSYRREDSIDATDRLYRKLSAELGEDYVFMDVDTIPFGTDFRKQLHQAVDQAAVVLVIIGDHWLSTSTRRFWWRRRRIDDPNDFVRIEIEAALSKGIPVVPVLVGQAQMPDAHALPQTLRDLAFQQAAEIRPGRQYDEHAKSLISTVKRYLKIG